MARTTIGERKSRRDGDTKVVACTGADREGRPNRRRGKKETMDEVEHLLASSFILIGDIFQSN